MGRWLAVLSLVLISVSPLQAQSDASALRVATRLVPPLVVQQRGALTGFSIDLWNAIAERLKIKTSYQIAADVSALLEAVRSNQADLGIAAVSITSARETDFDFSQPILNAGLQIMVRGSGEIVEPNPLGDLFRLFFSRTILVWLGIVLLLILLPAHLVWLLERRHKNSIIPSEKYFPGIFYAMFWAAGTLATQADQMPRQWLARVIAVLWMFTGVVFVAFYTAQLTATLTVQQIQGAINGPDELPGRRVGTTRGSTAAAFLRDNNAQVREFTLIEDAYQALLDKQIDAVVFDAPVLLFHAAHDGRGRTMVVGPVFHKEDYGIVFQTDSPLRKHVNGALPALREDGTYQQIYERWFGGK
jgi:polar amino acid transport system substrate-binding protein